MSGEADVDPNDLQRWSQNGNALIRSIAIGMAPECEPTGIVPWIIRALNDPSPAVREAAFIAGYRLLRKSLAPEEREDLVRALKEVEIPQPSNSSPPPPRPRMA
jgi:hypothetical protein